MVEKKREIHVYRSITMCVNGGYLHGSMDGSVHLTEKGLEVLAPILDLLGQPRDPYSGPGKFRRSK